MDKQIEEMSKDLKECLPNDWYWQKSVDSDTYFVAKHFYNAGYRKIPENAVVLTREELKAHDKALAEKFAEKVSQAIVDNTYPYFDKDGKPVNIWKAVLGFDNIDEIAKEITEAKHD